MSHRNLLLKALESYTTTDKQEQVFISDMIAFIKENPNCFDRTNLAGHITGSAWVLSPDEKKVLLTHHKKLNRWLQLGGHSDGDPDTRHVALREATEESGISGITLLMKGIFDVDIHAIPDNPQKQEPEHKHYDVRFLMKAPTEDYHISDESNALKWVSIKELMSMAKERKISPSMVRMAQKWLNRSK